MLGHSLGELAAAHVAGALSLDEACRIVAHRGALMHDAAGIGKMVSCAASLGALAPILDDFPALGVAAHNGPDAVVVSGPGADVDALAAALEACGVRTRLVSADYAFHSDQMAPSAARLLERLGPVSTAVGRVPMVSTVTARPTPGTALDAAYWARQLVAPVRFAEAIRTVLDGPGPPPVFVEVSPHPALSAAVAAVGRAAGQRVRVFPTLWRQQPEREALLRLVAGLHAVGRPLRWEAIVSRPARVVSLPGHPWQHLRHWVDAATPQHAPRERRRAAGAAARVRALLGAPSDVTLSDAGLSSLALASLRAALDDLPGGRALARTIGPDTPVGEVTALLDGAPEGEAPLPAEPWREVAWREVDGLAVNKREARNVLLSRAGPYGAATDRHVVAELRIDPGHPYFYEHPLDHVPGLYLIEAARQLGNWIAFAAAGQLDRAGVLDRIEADFFEFVEHDTPAYFVTEPHRDGIVAHLHQASRKKAVFTIRGRRLEASQYAGLRAAQRGSSS
ncbi:MAG: acyltransferase domain-containing protein [Myxococcota bacterium]